MADNFATNSSGIAASYTWASDDISNVHYPRTKIAHGADGSATDVSTASPLPVKAGVASTTLQDAATTGNGSEATNAGVGLHHAIYIVPAGTIATGAVQWETAASSGYSGTWVPLGEVVPLVTAVSSVVTYVGPLLYTRCRIVTTVTGSGGSVTVTQVSHD